MIYEEETALIRRGLFDVQNGVGLGRHEEIYHKALAMWLEKQGIPFVSKYPHPLMLNEETAHILYPDFVLWNKITEADRDVGVQVRDILRNIVDIHKTGYGTEITERLIQFGLEQKHLSYVSSPVGESVFEGRELGNTPFDCLLIENRVLLVFTALFDDNKFNFRRGLSFMNALNIPWGIAINFGKETVQIQGLAINKTSAGSVSHPRDNQNKTSVEG